MPETMPIESERRRPEFLGGRAVRLADGQEWTVPLPRVRMKPRRDESGEVQLAAFFTFGDAYDLKWARLNQARDVIEEKAAICNLAFDLLQRNYDLSDEECAELLAWFEGDDAGTAMLSALYDIASGIAPKPSPGG